MKLSNTEFHSLPGIDYRSEDKYNVDDVSNPVLGIGKPDSERLIENSKLIVCNYFSYRFETGNFVNASQLVNWIAVGVYLIDLVKNPISLGLVFAIFFGRRAGITGLAVVVVVGF